MKNENKLYALNENIELDTLCEQRMQEVRAEQAYIKTMEMDRIIAEYITKSNAGMFINDNLKEYEEEQYKLAIEFDGNK